MTKLVEAVARFRKCESGATAIEYGLIASLIVVAIIVAIQALGGTVTGIFEQIADDVTNAGG